jgi:hypothetical protein
MIGMMAFNSPSWWHVCLFIFERAPRILAGLAGDEDGDSDVDEGDGMSAALEGDEDEVHDEGVVDMAIDTLAKRVRQSHVGLAGDGDDDGNSDIIECDIC